jgi:hypothetical protein
MNEIAQHMAETLVPDERTVAAAQALADAGVVSRDQSNVTCYSVLAINSDTNDNISWVWVGDETVFDPGLLYGTRDEAFAGCDVLKVEGADATAFVQHWADGTWAVFINP